MEEAKRMSEETYRREVRSRMEQMDPVYTRPATSDFPPNAGSDGGIRLWQVLALVTVAVAITIVYMSYSYSASASRSTAQAAPARTLLAPRPVYVPMKESIASGQVVVQPGGWIYYRVHIKPGMRNPILSGSFNASGGSGNDVTAVVTTDSEFQNWINGHESRVLYSTHGHKTADSFNVSLPQGNIIFAISNKFSIVSSKTVLLNADLKYETLAESSNGL